MDKLTNLSSFHNACIYHIDCGPHFIMPTYITSSNVCFKYIQYLFANCASIMLEKSVTQSRSVDGKSL